MYTRRTTAMKDTNSKKEKKYTNSGPYVKFKDIQLTD